MENNLDKETEKQIQELQMLEQALQNVLIQKQSFQLESSEVDNALTELVKSKKGSIYKIVGQVMIESNLEDISKELNEKKELMTIRMKTLDNQENEIAEKIEELRQVVLGKLQK